MRSHNSKTTHILTHNYIIIRPLELTNRGMRTVKGGGGGGGLCCTFAIPSSSNNFGLRVP